LLLTICGAGFLISSCAITVWGAHLHFWARLGYVLAAAAGYGLLRSVLFWNTALAGMVLFLVAFLV
jgi:uncharacterized MAPEG superfamily protein